VTLLDRESFSESYINKIITNREDYAKRHGMLCYGLGCYTKYS
jgi:hypothetical protein